MSGFLSPLTGTRTVPTIQGDTLQKIALRTLGDASRWIDLASINGLVPPYLTDDPTAAAEGVLVTGQATINVPAAPYPSSGVAAADDVFGTDCLMTDGAMVPTANGDWQTVSGIANLDQALTNRLATHPGDLVYHPLYGCKLYRLVGQGATPANNELAATFLATAVASDPRIQSAINATGTISGDSITAACTAQTVDGKSLPTQGSAS